MNVRVKRKLLESERIFCSDVQECAKGLEGVEGHFADQRKIETRKEKKKEK